MSKATSSTIAITKGVLNKLSPPSKKEGRRTYWDAQLKGFGIRVNPSGSIVFVVQYRAGSRKTAATKTLTIGKFGSPWSPDTARLEARAVLERVHLGGDPAAERRAVIQEKERVEATNLQAAADEAYYEFDRFIDRYIDKHVKANKLRSLGDIEGTFKRDLRPFFRGKSVRAITVQDCKNMRATVGDRSHSAANKAHKWLNAAFMWGIEHDGLESSPMFGLKKPFRETERTRVLAEWEIALIWSVLPSMAWQFAMLMRLLILTGQRLREVAGIRWEELDLDKLEWIIPASRTKNKREHFVPISPQVQRLLLTVVNRPAMLTPFGADRRATLTP